MSRSNQSAVHVLPVVPQLSVQQAIDYLRHGLSSDEVETLSDRELYEFGELCHHWAEMARVTRTRRRKAQ